MEGRDNREEERGAQELRACDPNPAPWTYAVQHHKEYRGYLREGVGLAEDAGPKVTQSRDRKQHCARGQYGNIAAEHQHRVLPRNLVQDGKHWKHCAQQKLVRDRIKILPQQRLLMQLARQQPIESITETGDHEKNERPKIAALDQFNHNKRNENHAQQGELVRRSEDFRQFHAGSSSAGSAAHEAVAGGCFSPLASGMHRIATGSRPVFAENRCESEGRFPSGRSSSMRSIRCIGKKTTAGVNDSPSFTITTKSSKDASSIPLMLSPSGASARIMPQNLSRGFPSVVTTIAPGWKGAKVGLSAGEASSLR